MAHIRKAPFYLYLLVLVVVNIALWIAIVFILPRESVNVAIGGLWIVSGWVTVHMKKRLSIAATELLAKDSRRPILYLRSFKDDEQYRSNNCNGIYFDNGQSFEESLVAELKRTGPVVAIGHPDEKLPPIGAARAYVGDDWQNEVARLINECFAVVLMLGPTKGVHWEVSQLAAAEALAKTIFIVPPVGTEELQQRWSLFLSALPHLTDKQQPLNSHAIIVQVNGGSILQIDESRYVKRGKKSASYRWKYYCKSLRIAISRLSSQIKPIS